MELAKQDVTVSRSIDSGTWERLASALENAGDGAIDDANVHLRLFLQANQVCMEMRGDISCKIECHRCLEPQKQLLQVELFAHIVASEADAQQQLENAQLQHVQTNSDWTSSNERPEGRPDQEDKVNQVVDVVVAKNLQELLAQLEDEFLLCIPQQVCFEELCENAPPYSYGDSYGEQKMSAKNPNDKASAEHGVEPADPGGKANYPGTTETYKPFAELDKLIATKKDTK